MKKSCPESEVRSSKSEVRSPESGVRSSKFEVWSSKPGVQSLVCCPGMIHALFSTLQRALPCPRLQPVGFCWDFFESAGFSRASRPALAIQSMDSYFVDRTLAYMIFSSFFLLSHFPCVPAWTYVYPLICLSQAISLFCIFSRVHVRDGQVFFGSVCPPRNKYISSVIAQVG